MRISDLIDSPIGLFNRLGGRLERAMTAALKVDSYSYDAPQIVKHRGPFRSERVDLGQIRRWHLEYEMAFAIVTLQLDTGEVVRWIDKYDELVAILGRHAGEKKLWDPDEGSGDQESG